MGDFPRGCPRDVLNQHIPCWPDHVPSPGRCLVPGRLSATGIFALEPKLDSPVNLACSLWVFGTVSSCFGLFLLTCRGGVKQVQEKVFTLDSFSQLDLHPHLVSARWATRSLCSGVRLFYRVVFNGSLFGRVCAFIRGDELLEDIPL